MSTDIDLEPREQILNAFQRRHPISLPLDPSDDKLAETGLSVMPTSGKYCYAAASRIGAALPYNSASCDSTAGFCPNIRLCPFGLRSIWVDNADYASSSSASHRNLKLPRSRHSRRSRAEVNSLQVEINSAVRQWRLLNLAKSVVAETLDVFKRDRQPEVLKSASSIFNQVTDGHYQQVVADDDGKSLSVIDAKDKKKHPDELSRGTAEQLYIAVRLGLASEMASTSDGKHARSDLIARLSTPKAIESGIPNTKPETTRTNSAGDSGSIRK